MRDHIVFVRRIVYRAVRVHLDLPMNQPHLVWNMENAISHWFDWPDRPLITKIWLVLHCNISYLSSCLQKENNKFNTKTVILHSIPLEFLCRFLWWAHWVHAFRSAQAVINNSSMIYNRQEIIYYPFIIVHPFHVCAAHINVVIIVTTVTLYLSFIWKL